MVGAEELTARPRSDLRRFAKFLVVGVLNTAFGYACFALLLWLGAHYSLAALGATVCGVLFNFKTTGALVFGSRDNSLLLRFVGVYVVVFATQVACLKALTSAGMNDYLAGLVLVPLLAVFSYGLMRRYVFEAA